MLLFVALEGCVARGRLPLDGADGGKAGRGADLEGSDLDAEADIATDTPDSGIPQDLSASKGKRSAPSAR